MSDMVTCICSRCGREQTTTVEGATAPEEARARFCARKGWNYQGDRLLCPACGEQTYNHAFSVAFSVPGSRDPNGEDVTGQELAAALLRRVADLLESNQMNEACGAPWDTYEEN